MDEREKERAFLVAQGRRGEERRGEEEQKRREELCWKFDVLTIKERIRR